MQILLRLISGAVRGEMPQALRMRGLKMAVMGRGSSGVAWGRWGGRPGEKLGAHKVIEINDFLFLIKLARTFFLSDFFRN